MIAVCEWCSRSADEYEREFYVSPDASSDLLRAADERRATCRAGLHITELAYRWQTRRPGDAWPVATALPTSERGPDA